MEECCFVGAGDLMDGISACGGGGRDIGFAGDDVFGAGGAGGSSGLSPGGKDCSMRADYTDGPGTADGSGISSGFSSRVGIGAHDGTRDGLAADDRSPSAGMGGMHAIESDHLALVTEEGLKVGHFPITLAQVRFESSRRPLPSPGPLPFLLRSSILFFPRGL